MMYIIEKNIVKLVFKFWLLDTKTNFVLLNKT